ncbi:hypothetical protein [Ponticaulis profundi]|uniref:DUF1090 domain-containing protein n=1 Tax=Ponticaulis profundi TaxID=2665222 RepID=A0ABW1S8N2_9PROT
MKKWLFVAAGMALAPVANAQPTGLECLIASMPYSLEAANQRFGLGIEDIAGLEADLIEECRKSDQLVLMQIEGKEDMMRIAKLNIQVRQEKLKSIDERIEELRELQRQSGVE